MGEEELRRQVATMTAERDAALASLAQLRSGPCCPTCSDMEHNPESELNRLRAALSSPAPRMLTTEEVIDLLNEAHSEGMRDGHDLAPCSRFNARKMFEEARNGR